MKQYISTIFKADHLKKWFFHVGSIVIFTENVMIQFIFLLIDTDIASPMKKYFVIIVWITSVFLHYTYHIRSKN